MPFLISKVMLVKVALKSKARVRSMDVIPRREPPSNRLDHNSFLKRRDTCEADGHFTTILDQVTECVRQTLGNHLSVSQFLSLRLSP